MAYALKEQDDIAAENVASNGNGESKRTLRSVISIIPKSCYENPTWKGIIYFTFDAMLYGICFAALILTDNPLLLIPLWILSGLCVSALFILGHDAAHGALFKNKKLAEHLGRLSMLPTLHAYSAWVMGHNRVHHSFTIKQEKDFVWHPLTHEEYKELSKFGKLLHRIQWSAIGAGIYYTMEVWWKKMFHFTPPKKLEKEISHDKRIVMYFFASSFLAFIFAGQLTEASLLYMSWAWVKTIIIPWICFQYIIGATVHIHHIQPDIAWHSHGVWSKFKGQVEGTTNFRLPKVLNVFFHNIFIHIPHHVDPRIPFYNLPEAAEAIKRYYELAVRDQPFHFKTYLRATSICKLYDFERKVWLNYRGETVAVPTPAYA